MDHFKDQLAKGTWLTYRPELKIMDCTVRDGGPAGSIALRAETEYAYVARDVKDIVRIASLLLAILFGLWIVIDILQVVPIG